MAERRIKYSEKLKDPRWQKVRLKILERDEWACQQCFDSSTSLVVHHLYYEQDKEPWDYPDAAFITLCERCHETERLIAPEVQAMLFATIKKCFLMGDIEIIASGFENLATLLPASATSRYTAETIAAALGDWQTLGVLHEDWKRKLGGKESE